jgi:hypothetical protein
LREPVICDSACLIALERIGYLDLLPALFEPVQAPPAVQHEFGAAPEWLRVHAPSDPTLVAALGMLVDSGEAEALALASELGCTIILDDRARHGPRPRRPVPSRIQLSKNSAAEVGSADLQPPRLPRRPLSPSESALLRGSRRNQEQRGRRAGAGGNDRAPSPLKDRVRKGRRGCLGVSSARSKKVVQILYAHRKPSAEQSRRRLAGAVAHRERWRPVGCFLVSRRRVPSIRSQLRNTRSWLSIIWSHLPTIVTWIASTKARSAPFGLGSATQPCCSA